MEIYHLNYGGRKRKNTTRKLKMTKNKLLLIGWDAADWKIAQPLLDKGLMPALKSIIQNGVYGNMSTMNPPYSPMLWTSVATGKTPDKHGVLGFIELVPNQKALRPVTANSRKTRAIWNILHHNGLKSNLVGWWPSFPAEPINGAIVTDRFQKVSHDPTKQRPIDKGTIHPEELTKELEDLRMFPWEITKEHFLPFMPLAARIDQKGKNNGLSPFSRILTQNVSIHNAATYLLRNTEWDFMAIYFDMIDHFCHSFMKYHPPKLPQISQENYEIYKDVVVSAYRFQDMMLARVLQLIDEDTTVIIMSDHGYQSGSNRILKMPKVAAAPALEHRQFGMFVAKGPNIKKNEKIFGLSLIDVAPTVLHHFDLPVGNDMDGKVVLDIFKEPGKPGSIESWDEVQGDFGEHPKDAEGDDLLSDDETLEQLIELGYIERPDEKVETAIHKTKCDLKHNLARVYLGKKDYDRARELLLELLEEKEPIDLAPYYIDMMNLCLRTNDYKKAQDYLTEYKGIHSEVKYNIFFIESDILLGNGEVQKALEVLERERARKPNSEIMYRIGNIHLLEKDFENAKVCFQEAIAFGQDRAKCHSALAEALYELGEYEESVESALTSIELVKFYPSAHYTLAKSLEKLGDLDSAKMAYETALKLTPKKYHKAEKALENLEERLSAPAELRDKVKYRHREDQIVVVSGLPRSGTSLMMQMLDKGGLDVLIDDKREADDSNPKGYYEYEPVMSLQKDNSWMDLAQNKTVKIVAPLLRSVDPQFRYKVIFMKRDLDEVIKSQRKMIGKDTETFPVKLFNSYVRHLEVIDSWKEKEPGVELIYVDYKDVLESPDDVMDKIESFVGLDLNKEEMVECIDKSLYRNRVEAVSN